MSEDIQTTTSETTTTEAPSTPAPQTESAPSQAIDVGGAQASVDTEPKGYKGLKGKADAVPAAEVAAPFVPDWKYKFNGQEKEVDPMFRAIAKDKESLEKLKDFMQRADAVDMHKMKTKEYEEKIGQYQPTVETVTKLQELYQSGDHERVLQSIGYTDDMLFKIVQEKLNRQQLPPEQKALWEEKQKWSLEKEQLLSENEKYRSQAFQELTTATDYQLDMELGKAEYQGVKDAFDRANGSGSFKQLVVDRGAYLVDKTGRHVPPSEVMAAVVKEFSPFVQQNQMAGAAGVHAGAGTVTQKPKVIPNVGKGGGSPTRSAITSIAQLRKLHQQL
jgi:hypothetical protein